MMRDCERLRRGNCKTLRVAYGVRTRTFTGLRFFSPIFVLLDLSNVEIGGQGGVCMHETIEPALSCIGQTLCGVLPFSWCNQAGNMRNCLLWCSTVVDSVSVMWLVRFCGAGLVVALAGSSWSFAGSFDQACPSRFRILVSDVVNHS